MDTVGRSHECVACRDRYGSRKKSHNLKHPGKWTHK